MHNDFFYTAVRALVFVLLASHTRSVTMVKTTNAIAVPLFGTVVLASTIGFAQASYSDGGSLTTLTGGFCGSLLSPRGADS